MSGTAPFNRMPRIQEPLPQGEVKIPGPPTINPPPERGWLLMLLPLAGLFVMVGVYGGMRGDWTLAIPMVAMSGISMLTSIVGTITQRKNYKKKAAAVEVAYAEALSQKRAELDSLRREQQRIRISVDPDLQALLNRAHTCDYRLWERRPDDTDFLSVRLGLGDLPSSVIVSAPHPDMPDPRLEPAHAREREYANVPQVPVTASLQNGPLGIAGSLRDRTGLVRALICNLAVHHSYDHVHLLAVYSTVRQAEWQWLRWLPHTYALSGQDEQRYLANDSVSTQEVLTGFLEELHSRQNQLYSARSGEKMPLWPWLVLLVDDYALVRDDPAIHLLLSPEGRQLNATAIFMVDKANQVPMSCSAIVECQSDGRLEYAIAGPDGETFVCRPESADTTLSEQLARSLAPVKVFTLQSDTAMPSNVRLLDIMGVKDIDKYDIPDNWENHSTDEYLKVMIGARRGNQPMVLDLNHTGHGPHGLVAGTTGSGKSELVQTLVVALALTHHPDDVGFVLVDFKGGGTFSELVNLPHTLGMVTDLSGNLTERAQVALAAEIDRRKRLFNEAGVSDIGDYQEKCWNGEIKVPLPRLVIIIDEFAELVSDYPEFMDGLIAIARVGRSLGVHLILATQSPGGVVKQQIWANAKFRICLRVETRQESQEMLRRPEAANLPRMPGRGYLQVGNNDVFELFQVARVAGPYRTVAGHQRKAGDTGPLQSKERIFIKEVSVLGRRKTLFDSEQAQKQTRAQTTRRTDLNVVVEKLERVAQQMNIKRLPSPWPDPLPDHITLPDLLRQEGYAGWNGTSWVFDSIDIASSTSPPPPRAPACPNRPWLRAMLGLQDDPAHQRQIPLQLDLTQQDGHLVVIGAPGSGKEMWMRTLITSLARTHAPDELHFYLLEFSGAALQVFKNLPHAGGDILTPLDDERVPRLFRLLIDALDERKSLCSKAGVDGLVRLRKLQPDQAPPAIVMVIAGFAEFRTIFQEEMGQLTRLIREGGPFGIHVVLVGDRAGDIPIAISSVVARRVVLRLADTDEYSMVLGTRIKFSQEQRFPLGRGWYGRPPLEFQTASPGHKKDENAQIAELQQIVDKMEHVVEETRQDWQDKLPLPVIELPPIVPLAQLLSSVSPPSPLSLSVPIGLDYLRTQPALIDLINDGPNFMVSSTARGGKTTLLLTWALALAEHNSPLQVQFVLIAGRRNSLWPLEGLPHVLNYCEKPDNFVRDGVLAKLQAEIQRREILLSDSSSDPGKLPHIVVMFDDYDEFSNAVGGQKEVKEGLDKLAKRGRDVEIHSIATGPSLRNLGVSLHNDPMTTQLKIGRSGFVLQIRDANEQNPLELRIRPAELKQMPPGRGYVTRRGSEEMLQVATVGDGAEVASWVAELRQRWNDEATPAEWPKTLENQAEKETAMT